MPSPLFESRSRRSWMRPLSALPASPPGLASLIHTQPGLDYPKASAHQIGDLNAHRFSGNLTPPASPPLAKPPKRPISSADVLYMYEDSHADITVIQRATRVPIVSQSDGDVKELIYHDGRATYRKSK